MSATRSVLIVGSCGISLMMLTACGSSAERQAEAQSQAPSAATSSAASVVADAPAPTPPRTQWTLAGHVMTLTLRPGSGSGPVSSYEVRVAPLNQLPDAGREIENCPANGSENVTCALTPLKRGDWDVWVRAVGSQPDQVSPWYRGAYGNVSSCTAADGLSGSCEIFDKGPGGGFVFYNAGSRQPWGQYLEAAPGGWADSAGGQTAYPWCPGKDGKFSTRIGTSSAIGTGLANTKAIIAACGSNSAAGAAQAYNGGGLKDWSLASLDELDRMYDYRGELTMYGKRYWSSSQDDGLPSTAAQVVFSKQTSSKSSLIEREVLDENIWQDGPLRPIRAF